MVQENEFIKLAQDIGFAIATMKSFMNPSGVSGEAVSEEIYRLENAPSYITIILATQNTAKEKYDKI